MGEKEKLKVKLIAALVSEEIANIRRMKAKKNARGNSSECLGLMNWNIFISTIEDESFSFKENFHLQ